MKKAPEAFRTISEVADLLETPAHVLRFWESKFYQIRPVKRAGGRRYYRPDDVALIAGIKHLLQDRGMTIRGVQKVLQEQGVRHVMRLAPPVVLEDEAEDGVVSFPGGDAAYGLNGTVETAETAPDSVSPLDDAPGDDAPMPPSARPVAPAPVSATVSRLPVTPPRFRPDGADAPPQPDQPRADSAPATDARPDSPAPDRAPVAGAGPASDAPDAPPPAVETGPDAPQDDAPDSAAPETPKPDAWAPEPPEDDPAAPEPAEPGTPAPDTPLPDVLPAAARQAPTEATPDAQPLVAQTAVADRPAQMLRRIPRGGIGARSGQFGLLARRMDALLDRMSEASGAGRW